MCFCRFFCCFFRGGGLFFCVCVYFLGSFFVLCFCVILCCCLGFFSILLECIMLSLQKHVHTL